jgi:hypothetical protein
MSDLPSGSSIGEIITVLGEDFEYFAGKMVASARRGTLTQKDATHARSLIRALFALVEGQTHVLKVMALKHCAPGQPLYEGVRAIVTEKGYAIGRRTATRQAT